MGTRCLSARACLLLLFFAIAGEPSVVQGQPASAMPPDPFPGSSAPMDLDATGETAKRVTKVVGSAGGSVKTTGSDGTAYELTIPPGALNEPVPISMEPIAGLSGAVGGRGKGVILGPNGLALTRIALLRITSTSFRADPNSIAIAGYGNGYDSRRTFFRLDGQTVTIPVWHFTVFDFHVVDRFVFENGTPARPKWVPRQQFDRFFHWIASTSGRDTRALVDAFRKYREWMKKAAESQGLRSGTWEVRGQGCEALRRGVTAYRRAIEAARALGIANDVLPDIVDLGNLGGTWQRACREQAANDCKDNGDQQVLWDQAHAEADAQGSSGADASTAAYQSALLWLGGAEKACPLPRILAGSIVVRAQFGRAEKNTVDESTIYPQGQVLQARRTLEWNLKGETAWIFRVARSFGSTRTDGSSFIQLIGEAVISGQATCTASNKGEVACKVGQPPSGSVQTKKWAGSMAPKSPTNQIAINVRVTPDGTYELNLLPNMTLTGPETETDTLDRACPGTPARQPIVTTTQSNLSVSADGLGPLISGSVRPNGSIRDRTSFSGSAPFYVSQSCWRDNRVPGKNLENVNLTVDLNLPLQTYRSAGAN